MTRETRNHPPINGCTIAGPHPCVLSVMARHDVPYVVARSAPESLTEARANGHERGQRYVDTGICAHCVARGIDAPMR